MDRSAFNRDLSEFASSPGLRPDVSVERLMRMLTKLGYDVDIVVRSRGKATAKGGPIHVNAQPINTARPSLLTSFAKSCERGDRWSRQTSPYQLPSCVCRRILATACVSTLADCMFHPLRMKESTVAISMSVSTALKLGIG